MHRDLGTFLVRGITPRRIFANLLGRATGVTGGRDVNIHGVGDLSLGIFGFVSHLPHSLPVGLGAAMSFRYRGEPPAPPCPSPATAGATGVVPRDPQPGCGL